MKKRLMRTIQVGILFLVCYGILNRILFYEKGWLIDTLLITFYFSSSYFASKTVKSYKNSSYEAKWVGGIAIITFIIVVIFKLPNCVYTIIKGCIIFIMFYFGNNEFCVDERWVMPKLKVVSILIILTTFLKLLKLNFICDYG